MADTGYICERPSILQDVKIHGWFIEFVEKQYRENVFLKFGFDPEIATERVSQAYKLYIQDIPRVEEHEYNGESIDHFKQMGFLAYWLRRSSPVVKLKKYTGGKKYYKFVDPFSESFIMEAANELAAFDLGFRVCRYLEAFRKTPHHSWQVLTVDGQDIFAYPRNRRLMSFNLDSRLLYDSVYIMKQKNISPHAIGLIYKAIFTNCLKMDITA